MFDRMALVVTQCTRCLRFEHEHVWVCPECRSVLPADKRGLPSRFCHQAARLCCSAKELHPS